MPEELRISYCPRRDDENMSILTEAAIREKMKLATLMDDPFAMEFFRDNIPCTQKMLRVIMDRDDLVVRNVKVQYVMKAADDSRYVRLDIYAVDSDNRHYDVEIQVGPEGALPQRARYNSAMIDVNILKTGENYSVLKERESIVIFITERDVLGEDEPIYVIDRVIKKSGKPFNDGSHIVYVNASHQDLTTALGRLMHDFHCVKPEEMTDSVFARKAREMKGDEEMGVWKEIEAEIESRAEARTSESIAQNFIKMGTIALDEIAKACGLTLQRVQELAAGK